MRGSEFQEIGDELRGIQEVIEFLKDRVDNFEYRLERIENATRTPEESR
jgi:hypothetical protein